MAQQTVARRDMLFLGAAGMAGVLTNGYGRLRDECGPTPDVRSLIPVVGDGKWVWTEPPDNQTGYLEPRRYRASIGIELRGTGPATQIRATTTVPVELPEQRVDEFDIEVRGCQASVRRLAPEAGQLLLTAAGLARGQSVMAAAHFSLTLYKAYQGFSKERFSKDC